MWAWILALLHISCVILSKLFNLSKLYIISYKISLLEFLGELNIIMCKMLYKFIIRMYNTEKRG